MLQINASHTYDGAGKITLYGVTATHDGQGTLTLTVVGGRVLATDEVTLTTLTRDGAADAVASQGYSESTGWTWRKWESGVAEAWKHFDTSDALTEQYGSFYYKAYESTLPFEFAEVPQPDGSVKCDLGLGFVCFNANTTTTKLGFMVCSPVAEAEGAKSISLDVRGRWK